MVTGKRGWIRIAEASIAIMLLASVIIIVVSRQIEKDNLTEVMYNLQHAILEEASRNESIRGAVLLENTETVRDFIRDRLPAGVSFNITICSVSSQCTVPLPRKEVYVDDIIISSTFQQYQPQPKKLQFFAWVGKEVT